MGESPIIFLTELLITKPTRQVRIINTYSTYRTSTICLHSATTSSSSPIWMNDVEFLSLEKNPLTGMGTTFPNISKNLRWIRPFFSQKLCHYIPFLAFWGEQKYFAGQQNPDTFNFYIFIVELSCICIKNIFKSCTILLARLLGVDS